MHQRSRPKQTSAQQHMRTNRSQAVTALPLLMHLTAKRTHAWHMEQTNVTQKQARNPAPPYKNQNSGQRRNAHIQQRNCSSNTDATRRQMCWSCTCCC
jgi:hypothetical protein